MVSGSCMACWILANSLYYLKHLLETDTSQLFRRIRLRCILSRRLNVNVMYVMIQTLQRINCKGMLQSHKRRYQMLQWVTACAKDPLIFTPNLSFGDSDLNLVRPLQPFSTCSPHHVKAESYQGMFPWTMQWCGLRIARFVVTTENYKVRIKNLSNIVSTKCR